MVGVLDELSRKSSRVGLPLFEYVVAEDGSEDDDDIDPDEEPLARVMVDNSLLYDFLCGSSYDMDCRNGRSVNNTPEMICFPLQPALFSLDEVKSEVPDSEAGTKLKVYLDPNKYTLIFFSRPSDPKNWIGCAALQYQESISGCAYHLEVTFEMLFVKKAYRKMGVGSTMSREIARKITEIRSYNNAISANVDKAYVSLFAQATSRHSRKCFHCFSENFQSMLSLVDEDPTFEREDIDVPTTWEISDDA